MTTFTGFCQSTDRKGTVWIATVSATSVGEAIEAAREACAADWACTPESVHVLGIAMGDVRILFWED